MAKILYTHKNMTQAALKVRGDLHVFRMDGIAKYSKYQPLVDEFKPIHSTYSDSLLMAKLGGDDRIKAKNKAKKVVEDWITEFIGVFQKDIDKMSESDAIEFAEGAGFDVQQPASSSKKIDFLEAPVLSIEKEKGRSGVYNFDWKKMTGVSTYALFEVDKEGRIENIGHCDTPPFQLSGLEVGKPKTYCMKAIGKGTLASEMSLPVTIWVN